MSLPRAARLALVERENPELPLTRQVDLLSLARASLYYHPAPPSPEEVALKHRIDALYTAHPFYGSRRITAVLQREGVIVNRKAIQRHMQEMGIVGVAPGPHLSTPAPRHPVYPYLLRHVTSARAQPRLGHRHHLYTHGGGLALLGRRARLVLPLRRQLGTGPDSGAALCPGCHHARSDPGHTSDLEQRPGQPLHQPAVPGPASGR